MAYNCLCGMSPGTTTDSKEVSWHTHKDVLMHCFSCHKLTSGCCDVCVYTVIYPIWQTFTVFGPDAPDIPEAWFKHSEPHPLWGIFPRLAYEIFNEKADGWKITMKYFQNVVDTVSAVSCAIDLKTY